jgi:NAD(P)-dependent dehydrogenase (short-subunit alcohol dehydrogenase family)
MPEDDLTDGPSASALFDLSGRVAVVTGAGSGLGAAMARGLADCNATIVAVDVDEAGAASTVQAITRRGGTASAKSADVRDAAAVRELAARTLSELGRVDVLVNSAGITKRCPAESFPEDDFDRIIAVNLKGTFLCCQAFGRLMLDAGSGSIVNMASIAGLVGYPESPAYHASKGGVVQLTRGLAVEWVDRGVRVNAIAPALFNTPMARGAVDLPSGGDFISMRALRGTRSTGAPADIAGAAIFLASDASRLVTGHILPVDDGYVAA